ncbi:MAG TPA: hypothetical protein VH436_25970 [Vicinamibacterales bacterium]
MRRKVIAVIVVVVGLPAVFVIEQALETLNTLTRVERERDRWQRPEDGTCYAVGGTHQRDPDGGVPPRQHSRPAH